MTRSKTPSFWYRSESSAEPLIETAMAPLACIYALGHKIHQISKKPQHFSAPVICIGNIVTGGSGKTPSALALSKLIKHEKLALNPFFLTRGYGGHMKGPVLAHPQEHDFRETGDEALLLAKSAPTIVAENRALGAELAIEEGADIILMDDGLQNPGIHKDIRLVVIHGDTGFGNKKILPAGPLRSPLLKAITNADAFIMIGEDKRNVRAILPAGKPVFSASVSALETPPKDKKYVAFAGLGYPQKFFNTLDKLGCNVVETLSFPDHYPYMAEDLERLSGLAEGKDAELITTEKDYQRLPTDFKTKVHVLPIELAWDNEAALVAFLKDKLQKT